MKKRLLLALIGISFLSLTSCGGNSGEIAEEDISYTVLNDKYRNIYQIFPYSYADSNADGIGDINGIIDKLDYIRDLNYTGIWLTPVHESSTYHKYDVDDYKSIDDKFGTLDDYKNLVTKCHEKDMTILMDLVLNHSSDTNEWFTKCLYAHQRNKVNDQYYNYYNMKTLSSVETCPSGYTQIGNVVYESQFWSEMPDLNLRYVLDDPDGYLANDIRDILKFWLVDYDIDGFRLDAVTSYFSGNPVGNLEFLSWLNKEVKALKPNAYIVGEGSWGNSNENKTYYTSGIDGFFMFDDATADGCIAQAIIQHDATYIPYGIKKNMEIAGSGIPAPFIANHDTGRLVGAVIGRNYEENVKMANGLLAMMSGVTFSYYGDECGMAVAPGATKDEDIRQPIPWGDSYTCTPISSSTKASDDDKYPYGTVKDQLNDSTSIVNYVKKANLLRLQNVEIARGITETVYTNDDESFCVMKKTYNNKSVYIAINCKTKGEVSYDFTNIGGEKVVGQLCTSSYIRQEDKNVKKIVVPAMGIAIIR